MVQLSLRSRRMLILIARAAAGFLSVAGLMVYVILQSHNSVQRHTAGNPGTTKPVFGYLPISALSFAVAWNCISLVITGLGTVRWLSNRLRNGIDFLTAVELAAFGYVSFVNCLVNQWRSLGQDDKVLQVVGIILLSVTGAAQLLFFCYDCARTLPAVDLGSDEPESWLGKPPSYTGELREVKSFPNYSVDSLNRPLRPLTPPSRTASAASNKLKPKSASLHKKSGSLHRKSSAIRPVRPESSASIPDYIPQFVTAIGSEQHVEPLLPRDITRSPSVSFSVSRDPPSPIGSPVSPVTPQSPWSNRSASRFPIKMPARAHSRSKSSVVKSPNLPDVPEVPARRRAISSPAKRDPFDDPFPAELAAGPFIEPFTMPRSAPYPPVTPPPIESHPAYARNAFVTNLEKRHDTPPLPPSVSTIWGGQPYNDVKKFVPAYQETGGAFGSH